MSSAAVVIGALRGNNIYVDKMQLDFPEVCGRVLIYNFFTVFTSRNLTILRMVKQLRE